jgi:hypothetical protein
MLPHGASWEGIAQKGNLPDSQLYYSRNGTIRSRNAQGEGMPSTGLSGPYSLTSLGISGNITRVSPGTYALGKTENGTFYVHYVGRSDDEVAKRLQDHVPLWYPQFKFGYFLSPKAAFEKECRLYHDFSPADNDIHPARPWNANWECPVCTLFD